MLSCRLVPFTKNCIAYPTWQILGKDPTTTHHSTVDISKEPKSQAPAVNSEEEEYRRQATRGIQLHSEPGPVFDSTIV